MFLTERCETISELIESKIIRNFHFHKSNNVDLCLLQIQKFQNKIIQLAKLQVISSDNKDSSKDILFLFVAVHRNTLKCPN